MVSILLMGILLGGIVYSHIVYFPVYLRRCRFPVLVMDPMRARVNFAVDPLSILSLITRSR